MADTIISYTLEGEALGPTDLSAREIADQLKQIEAALTALIPPDAERPGEARLSVIGIESGSTHLLFVSNRPDLYLPAAARLTAAIRTGVFVDLPRQAQKALAELVQFVRKRRGQARLTVAGAEGAQITAEAIVHPDLRIDAEVRLQGPTTFYGEVLRVGGKEPRVEFQPDSGPVRYFDVSREIAIDLASHLYQPVAVDGTAVWNAVTAELLEFTVESWRPYALTSPVEAFAELRSRFGHHFDAIEDVPGWVAAIRRGEENGADLH